MIITEGLEQQEVILITSITAYALHDCSYYIVVQLPKKRTVETEKQLLLGNA
jgi:hypothetical protein